MIKPILFNAEMVRAILNGSKTVTRRAVKKKYTNTDLEMFTNKYGTRLVERQNDAPGDEPCVMPNGEQGTLCHLVAISECTAPYKRGDILWVRQTWNGDWCDHYIYKADGGSAVAAGYAKEPRWRPSIHMPKEAARIFLRVTGVRAERLQDISKEQIAKEGIVVGLQHQGHFMSLWDGTVKKQDLDRYGWNANPWVWVIEFERCDKPEKF